MSKQHWTVEENGNYKSSPRSRAARDGAGLSGIILRYNPKPNPPRGEQDRPTSYSLNFPALALTDWVSQPALAAGQIARALNSHGPMVEALKRARQFIENGVELGFIRMPDASTPDPAHETLPAIIAALEAAEAPHG